MAYKENDVFEFAGKELLAVGTSGRHASLTEIAPTPGAPVRPDLTIAGRRLEIAGTSGTYNGPTGTAIGRPVLQSNILQTGQQAMAKISPSTPTLRIADKPIRIS